MPINRESSTDVQFILTAIRRDSNEVLKNGEGLSDLSDFIVTANLTESINSAGIQGEINIQDSANLIASLRGDELWRFQYSTAQGDIVHQLQCYSIENRTRQNNTDLYTIKLCSPEFVNNEVSNLFGSSKVVFKKGTKSNEIIEEILRGKGDDFMKTTKKVFLEEGDNSHEFIMCNWRWFDTIYWIAQRTVRKGGGSKTDPQNGFLFWENYLGYHFQSIDKMIDDVNDQDYNGKTDKKSGKAKLYRYVYDVKKAGQEVEDSYKINTVKYVSDRNILQGLRNGTWAGFSSAFDPTITPNSQLTVDTPNAAGPYAYSMNDLWSKMSHLGVQGNKSNPYNKYADAIKALMETPRRIKYTFLPNRVHDGQGKADGEADNKLYEQLPYLEAYQYMRVQALKNIQLLVVVPGNVDLYAGKGIDIQIPSPKTKNGKVIMDQKYSGRYLIAAVRHKYDGRELYTEMLLYKDALVQK